MDTCSKSNLIMRFSPTTPLLFAFFYDFFLGYFRAGSSLIKSRRCHLVSSLVLAKNFAPNEQNPMRNEQERCQMAAEGDFCWGCIQKGNFFLLIIKTFHDKSAGSISNAGKKAVSLNTISNEVSPVLFKYAGDVDVYWKHVFEIFLVFFF